MSLGHCCLLVLSPAASSLWFPLPPQLLMWGVCSCTAREFYARQTAHSGLGRGKGF